MGCTESQASEMTTIIQGTKVIQARNYDEDIRTENLRTRAERRSAPEAGKASVSPGETQSSECLLKRRLRKENLSIQTKPVKTASLNNSSTKLEVGFGVEIHGLAGDSELNGQWGICKKWLPQEGRWHVDLGGGSFKFVRPENLRAQAERRFASEAGTAQVNSVEALSSECVLKQRRGKESLSIQTKPGMAGFCEKTLTPTTLVASTPSTIVSSTFVSSTFVSNVSSIGDDDETDQEEQQVVEMITIESSIKSKTMAVFPTWNK